MVNEVHGAGLNLLGALIVEQGKGISSASFATLPNDKGEQVLVGVITVSGDLAAEFLLFCRHMGLPVPERIPALVGPPPSEPSLLV